MTRTQLRDMPRQDLIELARKSEDLMVQELVDRLEDTDEYPFNTETYEHEY